jgi:glyoxylase-like metal-dependent hydrolase (beta-lactamase superfamily II)
LSNIEVKTFCLGMWMTNSYLVTKEGSGKCWLIDAGFEPESMIEDIKGKGLEPEMLIFTHAHLDHIAGTESIKKTFPNIRTAIHSSEGGYLSDPELNLSRSAGMNITAAPADLLLEDGQELDFEGSVFKIFHTPGHSPGGICLYQKEGNILFSGDTLFQGSVGRYDFPTSNGTDLMDSIKQKLLPLPEITLVYPGHGGMSRIGEEKRSNPFL